MAAAKKKRSAKPLFDEVREPDGEWEMKRAKLVGTEPRELLARIAAALGAQKGNPDQAAALQRIEERTRAHLQDVDVRLAIMRWRDALVPLRDAARAAAEAATIRIVELQYYLREGREHPGGRRRHLSSPRDAGARDHVAERVSFAKRICALPAALAKECELLATVGDLEGKREESLITEVALTMADAGFTHRQVAEILYGAARGPRSDRDARAVQQRLRRERKRRSELKARLSRAADEWRQRRNTAKAPTLATATKRRGRRM